MVRGVSSLRRKFRSAPPIIHERLRKGLARIGNDVVAEMDTLNPLPGHIEIGWAWGQAPEGAMAIGTVSRERDGLTIVIYARGDTFGAHWFEFGTAPRVQTTTGRPTGQIVAQPFFFPIWRANRSRVRSRLNGILRRAIRRANQL